MSDLIVSVPDHCLSFYSTMILCVYYKLCTLNTTSCNFSSPFSLIISSYDKGPKVALFSHAYFID